MTNQWQSIDTAPKDGTWILIYIFRDGRHDMESARWQQDDFKRWSWGRGEDNFCGFRPTHWMPLPQPPTP